MSEMESDRFALPDAYATIDLKSPAGNPFQLVRSIDPNVYERGLMDGNDWGTNIVINSLMKLVAGDSILLDVGANIGVVALAIAATGVPVLAIEMLPLNCLKLRLACAVSRLTNVSLVQAAASSVDGVLSVGGEDAWGQVGSGNQVACAMRHDTLLRLDIGELIGSAKHVVMKLDVEGHELEVLKGATELIRRHRPAIIFESVEAAAHGEEQVSKATKRYLEALDYRLFVQRKDILVPRSSGDIQEGFVTDFVAVPLEKPELLDRFEVRALTPQERAAWVIEGAIEMEPICRINAVSVMQALREQDPSTIALTEVNAKLLAADGDPEVSRLAHLANLHV